MDFFYATFCNIADYKSLMFYIREGHDGADDIVPNYT